MPEQSVNLGGTPSEANIRDALHICCISGVAGENLYPGNSCKLQGDRWVRCDDASAFAIVDPYRESKARPGDVFWVCLKPNTVSNVKHVWEHPSLPVTAPAPAVSRSNSEQAIYRVAELCGVSYSRIMEYAQQAYEDCNQGKRSDWETFFMGSNEGYSDVTKAEWRAFWEAYKEITGSKGEMPSYIPFSCSC